MSRRRREGWGGDGGKRERGRDSVEQHPFTNLVFTTAQKNKVSCGRIVLMFHMPCMTLKVRQRYNKQT